MNQPTKPRAAAVAADDLPIKLFRLGLLVALALAVLATAVNVSAMPQRPPRADLEAFPKLDLDDLAENYQEWYELHEAIMTPEEEEIFFRLESDSQRDIFMERFWARRDPSPGTPKNEFHEEYQRRLEYVERHFGRSAPGPGYKTERGRMYLLLGEPMNIKSMPYESQTYPVEIWWYHANPRQGVPPFFNLVFFKRNGVGEYRLYSPLVDGPMALLNPAGVESVRQIQNGETRYMAQLDGEMGAALDVLTTIDAELAQVSISLIPGDYGGQMGYGSMRSQMMLGDIESIPEKIVPSAAWAYPILTGMVEADVRFESMPIQAQAVALLDPSGEPFLHYGLMTEGSRLNLNNYEDNYYVTFSVAGSMVDDQNRIVTALKGAEGSDAKILQADLDEEQARRLRGGPLLYLDRLPVVDGSYNFDLVLENNVSREYGRQGFTIDVPAPWPAVVRSSPPLLLWAVFDDPQYDAYSEHYPFQVGPYGLIPALEPRFNPTEGILVFHQVYLPRGHQGQLEANYRLSRGGETVIDRTEYIDPSDADANGTVNHIAAIELEGVAAGDYELFVDVIDDDRGGRTFDVTINAEAEEPPHLHMSAGPPPTDPWFAYDRALQFQTVGRIEDAIEVLRPAVERTDEPDILRLQIELLLEAEHYEEMLALLNPLQSEQPNNTEVLLALAETHTRMGNNPQAIRFYERARLVMNEEKTEILNPLASAYYGDSRLDKAREILELSLQVNPDQPQIKRLLDEILGKGGGG